MNEGNYRALYRKARSLKEMGRHREAYEAVAKCSLAVPQVKTVLSFGHIYFVNHAYYLYSYLTATMNTALVCQDPNVIQLTQDLAKILGLKIRKAYVRSKVSV